MNERGEDVRHENSRRAAKWRQGSPLSSQKDIEIQHGLEVVEEEGHHRDQNHHSHAERDRLLVGDEIAAGGERSELSLDDLVHGREIQRERADAGDHHETADDDVGDGAAGDREEDVAGDAAVGLVEREEDDADEEVDGGHRQRGQRDGARHLRAVGVTQVFLRWRERQSPTTCESSISEKASELMYTPRLSRMWPLRGNQKEASKVKP